MGKLDSDSPAGKFYISEQRRIQRVLSEKGYVIAEFPEKTSEADILIHVQTPEGLKVYGVAEIKCRSSAGGDPLTLGYLTVSDGYLITHQKLKFGAMLSAQLGVPYYVIVSLMSDGKVIMWKITDGKGNFLENYKVLETKTQKTVNGGEAIRKNAFLPLDSPNLVILE